MIATPLHKLAEKILEAAKKMEENGDALIEAGRQDLACCQRTAARLSEQIAAELEAALAEQWQPIETIKKAIEGECLNRHLVDLNEPDWNDDYTLEISLTIGEMRAFINATYPNPRPAKAMSEEFQQDEESAYARFKAKYPIVPGPPDCARSPQELAHMKKLGIHHPQMDGLTRDAVNELKDSIDSAPEADSVDYQCPCGHEWKGDGRGMTCPSRNPPEADRSAESETPKGNGEGCMCGALSENECACSSADWTPREVYELRRELAEARADLANRADDLNQIRELQGQLATAREALRAIAGYTHTSTGHIAAQALAAIEGGDDQKGQRP